MPQFLLIFAPNLLSSSENRNCDYYAADSRHARLFRRKATSEIRHEGSSANVSFGEYEDAGEYPRRLGAFLVAKRKLHYCSKIRMQNQSVLVIGFACAVASKCYFTLLAGGVFLQEKEDEGDDQQDCDRKHAHRSVAGQRRGGRNEEGADNRSGLAENIIETVIFVGTILWNDLA